MFWLAHARGSPVDHDRIYVSQIIKRSDGGGKTRSQHEAVVAGLLLNPLLDRWWQSGVSPVSKEFRELIEARRKEIPEDAVWKYTPIANL